jgi:hypothetical protein
VSATGAAVESTATESVATAVESVDTASALALLPCPQLAIVRAMAATANKLFIMIGFIVIVCYTNIRNIIDISKE